MTSLVARKRFPLEPRLIAIAGGSGGAGRSTIALELAANLARRGRRTLLVDASLFTNTLAAVLQRAPAPAEEELDLDAYPDALAAAIIPGQRETPAFLSLRALRRGPAFPPRIRAARLTDALRALDFDEILLDLDGRPDATNASLFALSDLPLLVTTTETSSLATSVETLRQMTVFALLLQPDATSVEHRLMQALEDLPADFSLEALHDAFAHPDIAPLLQHVLRHAEPWLLLNRTRGAADRELAQPIALGIEAMTGTRPRVLGVVGEDPERNARQRQNATTEELRGDGDTLSMITQRLLHLERVKKEQPRVPLGIVRKPTDLIGVNDDSTPQEIRLAWRHLWDGLRRDSPFTRHVLPTREREYLLAQLEEASQRLQTWLQSHERTNPQPTAPRGHDSVIGKKLQNARTQAGISIRDLSLRSRIGLRYLEAIENFEVEALPREVYLRGYLREIGRALGLDPEALVEDYLEELLATRTRLLRDNKNASSNG